MTRVVWSSNAPWVGSGYGTETRHIVRGLRDLGYPVAVHAWFGLEGGMTEWEGVRCYPRHIDAYGNDAAAYVCRHFKADVLITLIDLWVMGQELGALGGVRYCPYFPIDHEPIPPVIAQRFPQAHHLITYSRWGYDLVRQFEGGKYAAKTRYIPHGLDCTTLRPAAPGERAKLRRELYGDWDDSHFIVGMVAANKGWPSRKSFPEALEAFARFSAQVPEARLYLHSYSGPEMGGPRLQDMLAYYGIAQKAKLPFDQRTLAGAYSDQDMRNFYCTFDVLLNPAQGEGCGLTPLEAQACGVPVITTDFSAMTEFTGAGWRVRPLRLQPTLIWGRQALADVEGVEHALWEAYRFPDRQGLAPLAREFAQRWDFPKIIKEYWGPYLAELDGGQQARGRHLEELRQAERAVVQPAGAC